MGKKIKTVSKIFGVAMLCAVMLSSEASAAAKMVAYESLSNYRCNNSTCGGAYLYETGWYGTCTVKDCKNDAYAYRCGICNRNYRICTGGHYIEIY